MHFYTDRKIVVKLAIIVFSVVIVLSYATNVKPTGNPQNGQRWYSMNNCDSCHGERGSDGMAPAIAGLELGFGSFMKNLRKPKSVTKPTYSEDEISKQDAADMYVWLQRNPQ